MGFELAAGFCPIRGIATAGYACLAMTELFAESFDCGALHSGLSGRLRVSILWLMEPIHKKRITLSVDSRGDSLLVIHEDRL